MLALKIQVPKTRERAGYATLRDGVATLATDPAVASATPEIAVLRANPACDPLRLCGHPPFGTYRLIHHEPTATDLLSEYGAHLLLFEPESGQALEAESFGRLALLVYGGARGADRNLRRTQGGLRLTDSMLQTVIAHLGSGDMKLELVPLVAPAWWQFWKSHAPTQPLSGTALHPIAAPGDEVTLLDALLRKSTKRGRAQASDTSSDLFDRTRDDRSDSGTRSADAPFEGKGGASGGAGASGSWDAGGHASGVDGAGRIIGGVAAVGAIGAMAAMAAHAGGKEEQEGSGGSVTGEATSGTDTHTAY